MLTGSTNSPAVATEKGKGVESSSSTSPPASGMANLHLSPSRQSPTALRPPPPPRPSAATKPSSFFPRPHTAESHKDDMNSDIDADSGDDEEENDEDNPFADRNAVPAVAQGN
jgi:hypothetical protein